MRRTAISGTGEHNKVPGTLDMSPKIRYSKNINKICFIIEHFVTLQLKL